MRPVTDQQAAELVVWFVDTLNENMRLFHEKCTSDLKQALYIETQEEWDSLMKQAEAYAQTQVTPNEDR